MIKTITHLFTAQEVANLMAMDACARRDIEPKPGTRMDAEMLAIFDRDSAGNPFVAQFKLDLKVEIERESWRGED